MEMVAVLLVMSARYGGKDGNPTMEMVAVPLVSTLGVERIQH